MICDRQPAARANRRSLDRFGLVLAAFCVRLLAFSTSTFAEDEPAASITILVYNYAEVSPRILTGAEREADRILNRAGVRAVWFDCSGKQPTIDHRCGKRLQERVGISKPRGKATLPARSH